MERLVLSCGGVYISSPEELSPEILGHAGKVYEHVLGEEKYTFVEEVANPQSCTILLKGPNDHTLAQLKDAVGTAAAVKNALVDEALVPGAARSRPHSTRTSSMSRARRWRGARSAAWRRSRRRCSSSEDARGELGYDAQDVYRARRRDRQGEQGRAGRHHGGSVRPASAGVYDNFIVKQQILHSAPVIATQLLLVDEVMRACVNMRKR